MANTTVPISSSLAANERPGPGECPMLRGASWLAIYLVVSAALSWPTLAMSGRALPQGAEPSATMPLFNLWTYQWNAHCAAHGYRGYWDAPILFPVRDTFAFSDPQPLTGLGFAALQLLTGDGVVAYDLLLLLALATNGAAAFVLLRALGLDRAPAGLAGVLAVGLPFVAQEIGALQVTVLAPPLLTFAALVRLVREPRPRWGLALGASLGATLLTCSYYGLFLSVLLLPAIVLLEPASLPRVLPPLVLAGALAALMVAPVVLEQWRVLGVVGAAHDPDVVERTSARPRDWVQVGSQGGLARMGLFPVRRDIRQGFALFPGVALLLLGTVGVVTLVGGARTRDVPGPPRWWLYVALATLLAFLLALGPHLVVGAWTPFALVQRWVPGFANIRNVYRLAVFVQLFVLLVAGVGLERVWRARRPVGPVLAVFLVTLALLETRVEAVQMYALPPDFRDAAWVARLRALPAGPVVMVPLPPISRDTREWEPVALQMVQSLVFEKPLLQGYSGFVTDEYRRLTQWYARFPDQSSVGATVLYGARWVVVDPAWLTDERRAALASLGSVFRVAYDGSDRQILEVITHLTPLARAQRPGRWRPHPSAE